MLNLSHEYNYILGAVGPSSESPNVVTFMGNVPPHSRSLQQFLLLTSVILATRDKLGALRLHSRRGHLGEEGKAPVPSQSAPRALARATRGSGAPSTIVLPFTQPSAGQHARGRRDLSSTQGNYRRYNHGLPCPRRAQRRDPRKPGVTIVKEEEVTWALSSATWVSLIQGLGFERFHYLPRASWDAGGVSLIGSKPPTEERRGGRWGSQSLPDSKHPSYWSLTQERLACQLPRLCFPFQIRLTACLNGS